jgi:hypothetical protein
VYDDNNGDEKEEYGDDDDDAFDDYYDDDNYDDGGDSFDLIYKVLDDSHLHKIEIDDVPPIVDKKYAQLADI